MSIEDIIGHRFANKRLLEEALTHPGCAKTHKELPFNYQRLEFLGDSVLGMVVAEIVYELYPQDNEGSLAKRHAALVRGEALAGVARELGLGDYMKVASGADTSGRENASNLEDMCEALIGALYLDGGLDAAQSFIKTHWTPLARGVHAAPKDAKTALQEWAQGKGLPLPAYSVLETTGPAHAPEFTIEVRVETAGGFAKAKAASKRQAEQLAATALLEKLVAEK
jgi:ribonuclease III